MNESVVKEALLKALRELENSGEIVVVHPSVNAVAGKLNLAVQEVSPNMLTAQELGGIISALNANNLGFGLDDRDFQTIIGLTKEELKAATDKLKARSW
ncbi:hypothetical protein [Vibrio campbellii]|jgi:hypothetical protein|uniref:Uncharacterized protein n=1 Tax=Vibrio campbellii TaxID=680 RepID=A0AAE9N1Q7_9VIBR|nr:hypothetical protein [Vibrio campbellii]UTZ22004.1 hypothetical protein HB760_08855 [Vibrio campbellii]UTZ27866.1 hypothetical protein HB761_14655 [Vibrio campbellii]UTZ30584.1 hypothetical protein HB762_03740 [Vibrio campbellii]